MKLQAKIIALLLALNIVGTASLWAQNTVQTVSQVTNAVALTSAVDYTITGTTPFATAGSVDIQNADAVLILQNVRPATVKNSYLSKVRINGQAAKAGQNCWVEIHLNGTIVYPHTELGFRPLTAYSDDGFAGTEWNDFEPYTKYTNGEWVDNIRSFRVKRGYMVTLACNANGSGWSKVFIAQDADLEIDLSKVDYGKYIAGREGFIRVFPWRNVTKKGTAGDPGLIEKLNTTWRYGWDGGQWHDDYIEYIPQRHHIGWPGWGDFANGTGANTLLLDNEPDNSGDAKEKYTPVDEIEQRFFIDGNQAVNAYLGGLRIGSPAMSGDARGSWLSRFFELCEEYNCRVDFVADHCYWLNNGGSFWWQMDQTYNKYRRPIWITEWNYGANWTSWPGSDTSGSDANQAIEKNAISDIVGNLESHSRVERYAIYNWVEDCRTIVLNGKLTQAGQWYADLKSNSAYNPINEYTMGWTYHNPSDLNVGFNATGKVATVTWHNNNGKQIDSVRVERKIDNETSWTLVGVVPKSGNSTLSYKDQLTGISGLVTYRVREYGSDRKVRATGTASITVGGTTGSSNLQYGTLMVNNANTAINTVYDYPMAAKPAVIMGLQTINNTNTITTPFFRSAQISKTEFTLTPIAWTRQANSSSVMNKAEQMPFMVIPFGNYTLNGGMEVEVGKVERMKADTVDVVFNQPFPDGITPIVVATVNAASSTTQPIMHKVWDITNTGFRAQVMYEDGEVNTKGNRVVPTTNHTLAYIAATPGNALIDAEAGTWLAAGVGDSLVSGKTPSDEYFTTQYTNDQGQTLLDTLQLTDPIIFCDSQTKNLPTPFVLRNRGNITVEETNDEGENITYTTGFKVRRVVDESVTSGQNTKDGPTADRIGWIVLHRGASKTPTAIRPEVSTSTYSGDELDVRVINHIVYVKGHDDFQLYTARGTKAAPHATQTPGVYIVRAAGKTAKIIIR